MEFDVIDGPGQKNDMPKAETTDAVWNMRGAGESQTFIWVRVL